MTKADDFDMFYAATSRRLVRQIFAMTGDLSEAEDAVQEAYGRGGDGRGSALTKIRKRGFAWSLTGSP
jgi:RNA polymerase sigma-70 factor, ECF subfamily